MTQDHNNLRAHYRALSQKLAKKKQARAAMQWLSVWLFAVFAVLLAII